MSVLRSLGVRTATRGWADPGELSVVRGAEERVVVQRASWHGCAKDSCEVRLGLGHDLLDG
jgi:hypothetical protein